MKALKIALKVDTFIQGIAILIGIGSLIGFAIDKDNGWIALSAFCLLGALQVLSAIIMGIALKDKRRFTHILQSVLYFGAYIIVLPIIGFATEIFNLPEGIFLILCALYIIGIPIFFAIRYFSMSMRDMIKVNSYHRSFWDL